MNSVPRSVFPSSASCAGSDELPAVSPPKQIGDWHHIGVVAQVAVWDEMNRAKDRRDEAIESMRLSDGMTLDQFLESAR